MKVHLIVDVDVLYREVPPSAQEVADEIAVMTWRTIDTRLGWVVAAVKVSDHRG